MLMPPITGAASVRAIRTAVADAVLAAFEADPERFKDASTALAALHQQRLTVVQGTIVRQLLEDLHPDGLAGEDAQEVLTRTFKAAAEWYPPVDVEAMIAVLMGALGAADPDETSQLNQAGIAVHGSLLIADLLTAGLLANSMESPSPEKASTLLNAKLDHAFAEIQRAETMEMP
jgi:hypothetical protein